MKQLKKMLSFFLSLVLLLSSAPVDVSAAEAGTDTIISVESENVTRGENVSVDIVIQNNPGILGATLEISFAEELTLLSATSGEAFSYLSMTKPGEFESPCKFMWDGVDFSEEEVKDGTILTLTFSVAEDAEAGVPLEVTVSAPEGDVYDNNLEYVDVTTVAGSVTVLEFTPGDLNNDGRVNVQDVILLRRYLVGGYDVDINTRAANVNGDSKISSADVILIRRYLAGGYNVELCPSQDVCAHTMEATEAKAATCEEDGNIVYWYCTTCDKYYTDAYGNQETTLENTVILAIGHNQDGILEAVEPTATSSGLTEGKYCTNCDEVMVPQEEWTLESWTIKYDIDNGDDYIEGLGLTNLENSATVAKGDTLYLTPLEVEGYRFLGWSMQAGDGRGGDGQGNAITFVQEIENVNRNLTLYGHWAPVPYDIQYKSDLVSVENPEDKIYTVDENKILPTLKLDGYTFAGWTDYEGKRYTSIKKGTTNDIILYANWISDRNQAWAKKELDDPFVYEDAENNVILFAYEIGDIKNVPVYEIHNFGKINESGVPQEVTAEYSVTMSDTLMSSCSTTVAKATTDSSSWTLSKDWTDSVTISEEFCIENGIEETEAENICQSETGNWYVSNSKGGSRTSTEIDSTDTYDLTTENNNTKSWSDDYEERKSYGDETLTYDTSERTHGYEVNGKVSLSQKTSAGLGVDVEGVGELSVGKEWGMGVEVGGSYENKTTDKTGTETTKKGDDTTTMKGEAYDKTTGSETGTIKNHTSNTANTSTWNSESGYGGSSTTSKEQQIAKTLSQMISSKTGYGQSYIGTEGESTTQGFTQCESNTDEYSSQVTYSTAISEKETVTYTTSNTTSGYHRWVMAGTAHVFAVVGYDIETMSYFVYNFSIMDDAMYRFEDYSYNSASYDDNQSSVIPFEIPHDIADYVNTRLFATDGLEVDLNGTITAYTGEDTVVSIPDYARIDNKDGTFTVVKVTGLSSEAFSGNENITGVRLSRYINTIPDNAFKGCTNLWDLVSYATSIGDYAFEDCPLMNDWSLSTKIESIGEDAFNGAEYLTVNAANADVVEAALKAGAKNIVIGINDMTGTLDQAALKIPKGTNQFVLKGYDKTFNNLIIDSEADSTTLNRINIDSEGIVPLQFTSPSVGLYQLTVNSTRNCVNMLAESTTVDLYGQVNLNSQGSNAMLCKNAEFIQSTSGLTTKLNCTGNLVTCGTITGTDYLNFVSGEIQKKDVTKFNNMLVSYTLTFDANDGDLSEDSNSRVIYNGEKYGALPIPAREYFTFLGWYTAVEGGTQITETSIVEVMEDQTLYAQWGQNVYSVKFDANGGEVEETLRVINCGEAVGELPVPERAGYDFEGWFTAEDEQITTETMDGTEGTITAIAKWTARAYTVSWNTGTGYKISVSRTSSPYVNAATGDLSSGATVYEGDVLSVSYSATTGYSLGNNGATSITVTGNVTSSDIYASATANNYTYKIVYQSSNGVALGSSTATYKYGTINKISAPAKDGYTTPGAQTVSWNSTSAKTITFVYKPIEVSTTKTMSSGDWRRWEYNGETRGVTYSVYAEYRNRTEKSVQIRVVWTNTLCAYDTYGFGQYFTAKIGGISTGEETIASSSKWSSTSTSARSATAYSDWITVSVSATQRSVSISATTRDLNSKADPPSWSNTMTIPTY